MFVGSIGRWSLVGLIALSSVMAAPLYGQDTPRTEQTPAEPQTPTTEQGEPLSEEIVVTARKREENVQDVPVAVTVVTSDELEEAATADISELQGQVPNLAIYQGRNQSTTLTAFLRGIGQADPLWGVDPGVGLYIDDVYVARPQGALLDVYDVARIEVLRGPQGTLYGKNTIGGAIKYVSRPLTDDFGGTISISPGTQSNLDLRASLNGALIPGKLRGKIAFASLRRDGYGENLFTGREVSDRNTLAARGALDWLITDKVKAQFSLDYTKDDAEPKGYQRLVANPLCPAFGITCAPNDSRFDTNSGLAPLNGTDSMGASIVVSSDFSSAWSFKSITAYRESDSENNIDFDTTQARIVDVQATYYDEQLTQELQFVYDAGTRFTGVLGAYYFDGEAGGLVKNIFVNAQFGTTNGKTLTNAIAIFGDGSYALSDRVNLNGGLRVTREEKNGIAFNAGYANDQFSVPVVVLADYNKTATFDSIAPKFGIDYKFTDSMLGYATASRGFKSGGFNVRAQATAFPESAEPFDDEVLTVGEVGLKSVLAAGQLVLNTAVFHGKYEDIQVSTFTAFDANGDGTEESFFGNFINAGSATMNGVEVEFDMTPRAIDWFAVSGFASYLDLKPDEVLDANRDGFVDTQVITNAPEWTGGLRFNFDFPVMRGLLTASTGAAYRSESILTNEGGSFAGRPVLPLSEDAYTLIDAWVSWLSPDAQWRFGLNGKNLTDKGYITNGYNIPALGVVTGSYGAPRTVLATIEYRF
ncbi:MAG: iron complex outerrane recepter protein [Acidobacteriota bacterium]|jgi:iron complex outermembrane receptor protein|nr:iron complex outerrane recepter protein [Acidobacteriota bacterium]